MDQVLASPRTVLRRSGATPNSRAPLGETVMRRCRIERPEADADLVEGLAQLLGVRGAGDRRLGAGPDPSGWRSAARPAIHPMEAPFLATPTPARMMRHPAGARSPGRRECPVRGGPTLSVLAFSRRTRARNSAPSMSSYWPSARPTEGAEPEPAEAERDRDDEEKHAHRIRSSNGRRHGRVRGRDGGGLRPGRRRPPRPQGVERDDHRRARHGERGDQRRQPPAAASGTATRL